MGGFNLRSMCKEGKGGMNEISVHSPCLDLLALLLSCPEGEALLPRTQQEVGR